MTRAWVEVDLGALCRNGAALAARAGVPLLPMVKADGYGVGGLRAALALESLKPWGFGVASVAEGDELRRGGIAGPILVFTPILRDEIDALRRSDLTPVLGEAAVIESWARTGRPWHLHIDTGMWRAGMPWDAVGEHRDLLMRAAPEGVCTHFHSAELDDGSREAQEKRFSEALAALPLRPAIIHCENGSAVQRRAPSPWTLVRPGIFLYGVATRASSRFVRWPPVKRSATTPRGPPTVRDGSRLCQWGMPTDIAAG
jgi:alanine racemase